MTSGVYGLFNKQDDSLLYVGSSQDIEGRFKKHITDLQNNTSKNTKLLKAYNENVFSLEDLTFKILSETEDLIDEEKFYIQELNPQYNATLVNELGFFCHAEETRQLISERTKEAMNDPEVQMKIKSRLNKEPWNKGISIESTTHTPESNKKISEKLKKVWEIRKQFGIQGTEPLPIQARIRNNLIQGNKYGVYIAGFWGTPEQENTNNKMFEILDRYGVSCFRPRYDAGNASLNDGPLNLEKAKKLFCSDLLGLHDSYMIIADITNYGFGRDAGTLIEVGYMNSLGKPVVLLDFSENKKSNVMLAGLAQSYIRSWQEFEDWLNGEIIMHIADEELE